MDYLNFRSTDKQKLSEFNLEEIRGWMIEQMTQIEFKIDGVIVEYFKPEKRDEFNRIVLNSSIITMGAKTKILRNIKAFDKNIISKIQKISNIRNAFAHLPLSESVEIKIIKDVDGKHIDSKVTVTSQIEVMYSSGELKIRNSQQQVKEFFDLDTDIREYFNNFIRS